jgi:dipeptide/tripeptide permease
MLTGRLQATLIFLAASVIASPAWAVQTHGGSEGLISHQIGHLLFAVGMAYLLYRLRTMRQSGRGWFEFKTSIWLLIAWNLVTFTGHWINEFIAKEQFVKDQTNILSFTIASLPDAIYYLTRLDHLILVPSFAFLLLALRKRGLPQ